ncbi:unnamed protein product [Gongylonema pulchrum]|uniref:G_PROTEIN_RECEP_F1_2 domain-containing protein n=1 Tax=Gongylonema pulchrum TaxID=637853 RepID=A0A183D193_9BILA|nr:unnamed protein product [Gongylonema pulchrum]
MKEIPNASHSSQCSYELTSRKKCRKFRLICSVSVFSTLNPFIYGTTMKSFKRSFQYIAHFNNFCPSSPFRFFANRKGAKRFNRRMSIKQGSSRITTELSLSETRASNDQLTDDELAIAMQCGSQEQRNGIDAGGEPNERNDKCEYVRNSIDLKLYSMLVDCRSTDL